MSPNNSNCHLNSYQYSSEHKALNVVDDFGSDNSVADIGINIDSMESNNGNNHRHQSSSMPSFFLLLQRWFPTGPYQELYEPSQKGGSNDSGIQRRNKIRALVILVSILSVGIGWFVSSMVVSLQRHHNNQQRDDNELSEPENENAEQNGSSMNDVYVTENDDATRTIPNLIWSDEFDGDSLDLTKWTFVNGNGCDVGLCGWGNNELEFYTPSNTHVSNGKLIMEAQKFVTPGSHPASYTSSKIISRGKADFGIIDRDIISDSSSTFERSRRFEAKLKLPWGVGIWPAFWMLPTYDTFGGWPKSGEIDIMENIGKEGPNTVHGTVHYGLDWPQHQYSESGITLSQQQSSVSSSFAIGNLNETFHTYAVERLPGIVRWYIDDIEYSSISKEEIKPYHWPFDEEFYFIFNLAVGGNWPGNPVEEKTKETDGDSSNDNEVTIFPQRLEVDYVRVYEGSFPRLVGNTIVDCLEKNVVYHIVNVEATGGNEVNVKDLSYTWTVPSSATIIEGQGTSRILVNFDSSTNEINVKDSEIIHVRVNDIGHHQLSNSIGLTKLYKHGIGLRVKIVDFDGKCSLTNTTVPALREFDFDCGRPSTCTPYVLHRMTDEYTCGERIQWLVKEMGMDEIEACQEVGFFQFHGHCGPCNPLV